MKISRQKLNIENEAAAKALVKIYTEYGQLTRSTLCVKLHEIGVTSRVISRERFVDIVTHYDIAHVVKRHVHYVDNPQLIAAIEQIFAESDGRVTYSAVAAKLIELGLIDHYATATIARIVKLHNIRPTRPAPWANGRPRGTFEHAFDSDETIVNGVTTVYEVVGSKLPVGAMTRRLRADGHTVHLVSYDRLRSVVVRHGLEYAVDLRIIGNDANVVAALQQIFAERPHITQRETVELLVERGVVTSCTVSILQRILRDNGLTRTMFNRRRFAQTPAGVAELTAVVSAIVAELKPRSVTSVIDELRNRGYAADYVRVTPICEKLGVSHGRPRLTVTDEEQAWLKTMVTNADVAVAKRATAILALTNPQSSVATVAKLSGLDVSHVSHLKYKVLRHGVRAVVIGLRNLTTKGK